MSPQTDYNTSMAIAMAGMLATSQNRTVRSMKAKEQIQFGVGTVKFIGVDDEIRLPISSVSTIKENGGTYTAGDIVVTVNGYAATAAYDTDKATTLAALAVAIAALAPVSTCTFASNDFVITGVDNEDLTTTIVITAITGNMTITSTVYTTSDTFFGIAVATQALEQGSRRADVLDQSVITISGDVLNTADTVIVTVNGVAAATVTYATSEAVTLGLVSAAVSIMAGIASVSVSGRVLTVLSNPGLPLVINSVVIADNALAAVAPSAAIVASSQDVTSNAGQVVYDAGDVVSTLRKGQIYVLAEEAITTDDSVFVRFRASGSLVKGGFRTDVDSGTAVAVTGWHYTKGASAGGFAIVETNLP